MTLFPRMIVERLRLSRLAREIARKRLLDALPAMALIHRQCSGMISTFDVLHMAANMRCCGHGNPDTVSPIVTNVDHVCLFLRVELSNSSKGTATTNFSC